MSSLPMSLQTSLVRLAGKSCAPSSREELTRIEGTPRSDQEPALASSHYAELVEAARDLRLWDTGLRQQIYLGDEAFVQQI